ncbi:hypothetical protein B0H13DRAFT_1858652 [Mycena leptocephala]|nr:hypothetical protein B0H13DRAFT_1858652 [Mycena leptocephala]
MIKTVTDAPQENERLRIALTDPKYHVDAWDYGVKLRWRARGWGRLKAKEGEGVEDVYCTRPPNAHIPYLHPIPPSSISPSMREMRECECESVGPSTSTSMRTQPKGTPHIATCVAGVEPALDKDTHPDPHLSTPAVLHLHLRPIDTRVKVISLPRCTCRGHMRAAPPYLRRKKTPTARIRTDTPPRSLDDELEYGGRAHIHARGGHPRRLRDGEGVAGEENQPGRRWVWGERGRGRGRDVHARTALPRFSISVIPRPSCSSISGSSSVSVDEYTFSVSNSCATPSPSPSSSTSPATSPKCVIIVREGSGERKGGGERERDCATSRAYSRQFLPAVQPPVAKSVELEMGGLVQKHAHPSDGEKEGRERVSACPKNRPPWERKEREDPKKHTPTCAHPATQLSGRRGEEGEFVIGVVVAEGTGSGEDIGYGEGAIVAPEVANEVGGRGVARDVLEVFATLIWTTSSFTERLVQLNVRRKRRSRTDLRSEKCVGLGNGYRRARCYFADESRHMKYARRETEGKTPHRRTLLTLSRQDELEANETGKHDICRYTSLSLRSEGVDAGETG